MSAVLLVLFIGHARHDEMIADTVDLVEIYHQYSHQGKNVRDHIIFWDWYPDDCVYHVVDYRLVRSPAQLPVRNHRAGLYVSTWRDVTVLRRVTAKHCRETRSQKDPEVLDRKLLHELDRRGLTPAPQHFDEYGLPKLPDPFSPAP